MRPTDRYLIYGLSSNLDRFKHEHQNDLTRKQTCPPRMKPFLDK